MTMLGSKFGKKGGVNRAGTVKWENALNSEPSDVQHKMVKPQTMKKESCKSWYFHVVLGISYTVWLTR